MSNASQTAVAVGLVLAAVVVVVLLLYGGGARPSRSASAPAGAATDAGQASIQRGASVGDGRPVAQRVADASLAAQITQALARERTLRVFDFDPVVASGRAVLYGDVNTRAQWQQARRVAASVDGVDDVVMEVTVGGEAVATADADGADAEAEGEAPADPPGQYHTVEAGDTLWSIARRHDTSVSRLRRLNDLGDDIRPGQRIRVR
jgi:LysM repeat protein